MMWWLDVLANRATYWHQFRYNGEVDAEALTGRQVEAVFHRSYRDLWGPGYLPGFGHFLRIEHAGRIGRGGDIPRHLYGRPDVHRR
jgi:hypothetical protein